MNNRLPAAALLALLMLGVVHAFAGYTQWEQAGSGHAYGSDDAYITYRYARNLIAGHGLVFNPGERVEGYSNFLYLLLMAPAFVILDPSHIYTWSLVINLLCTAAAFCLLYRHVRSTAGPSCARAASVLLLASPTLWVWTASGMEIPLVVAVTLAIWTMVERVVRGDADRAPLGLYLAIILSVLVRADGFVAPAIAVGYLALMRRWRTAARAALVLGATLGAYVAWRLAYYGYPWPNTFYAKVAGAVTERFALAVAQLPRLILRQGLLPAVTALAVAPVIALRRGRVVPLLDFGPAFMLGWLLYWLYIGGDNFGERFLVVLIPLGIAELTSMLALLDSRRRAAIVALVATVQLLAIVRDPRFNYSWSKYDRWSDLGRFLAVAHPGATLAIDAAGKPRTSRCCGPSTCSDSTTSTSRTCRQPRSRGSATPRQTSTTSWIVVRT